MNTVTKTMCIDFHAHALPQSFRNAVAELGIDPIAEDGFPLPAWSTEAHLQFMAEAGISRTLLSAPVPHLYNGNDAKARTAARAVNCDLAETVGAHPDSFGFVACIPLPDIEGTLSETAYALDTLGASGVKVATNMGGVYLGDPCFDPIMEEWNRRKTLAVIHPCRARQRPENVITGKVAAIFEYPADTTRAVLNMIAHRTMTRFPDITWIVPHCGAFLPYMLQRFTGVSGILASMGMMETVDVQAEFERLYFDIAGDPEPNHLAMLALVADASHILYGSDYPHSPASIILAKKRHFDANKEYTHIRERIYHKNAMAMLERGGK